MQQKVAIETAKQQHSIQQKARGTCTCKAHSSAALRRTRTGATQGAGQLRRHQGGHAIIAARAEAARRACSCFSDSSTAARHVLGLVSIG